MPRVNSINGSIITETKAPANPLLYRLSPPFMSPMKIAIETWKKPVAIPQSQPYLPAIGASPVPKKSRGTAVKH